MPSDPWQSQILGESVCPALCLCENSTRGPQTGLGERQETAGLLEPAQAPASDGSVPLRCPAWAIYLSDFLGSPGTFANSMSFNLIPK